MHLPHPYALPSPLCTFLRLCTPDFNRRLSFSLIRTFIHLYTFVSSSVCTSRYFSALFVSYIRACVYTYMRLLSLMCSFQTVFSLILVFWSATYSGGSAVLNFCCKSVHDYNHEFTLQKHWHSSLKLCQ